MSPVLAASIAAFLSFILTGLATWYSRRRGLIDHPGERHSHVEATPRGGGAGLLLALVGATWIPGVAAYPDYWLFPVLAGVAVLAALGWWDDHRPLSAKFRFAVQLAVSIALLWFLPREGWAISWWAAALFILFTAWMINLYNFMDGSNGMAGAQAVFGGLVLAILFSHAGDPDSAWLALMIAACSAGFLPWNLGKARVFMGDVGSLALGFLFAALLVHGVVSGAFSLPVGLLVMALFLADSTLTLLLRVLRGERWYNAHRQHLYQRIIALGWTHGRVLLIYQAINLALVVPGIVIGVNHPALAWPAAVAVGLVLSAGWYLSNKRLGAFAPAE
jgi:UDP-N-acetylmuramyl pentapeptide phosphotransferase/UDP-N-acetylglucosamine-1-phosphate transferase